MAGVATAAYSADALASPVDGSLWDFAVPLVHEDNHHSSKQRESHDSNSIGAKFSRQRTSNGSRSSSVSRNVHAHESPYLASNRGRREPSLNRHGSEVGSMRDAFGSEAAGRKEPEEADDDLQLSLDGKTNQEKWIHRDKLAKIESEELHQAAILFQRRMRGESKSSVGRGRSYDSHQSPANGTGTATSPAAEYSEPWPKVKEEPGKRGVNNNVGGSVREHWDLRRPEEIAADDAAASLYSHPGLGKSASRIPISTASPVPILGRDSGSSRSRAATDEEDRSSRNRRASEPITIEQDGSTPSPQSRPGSRGFSSTQNTGKKTVKSSTNRKTSAPPANRKTSTPRSRAVSGNNTQRPTTRSGESRLPTTANRPEGDPPWLATMYKPDPRLPPDQQMIPTVAKKMMQERWEKEGRTPNTYDRHFAPLAVHPFDTPPPVATKAEPEPQPQPQPQPVESLQLEDLSPRPSKSPEPPRPNTSTGYSTMPKVQETPPMGLAPNPNPNWSPPVVTAQQLPKKEKSCGCCIVM
ncbi:hypothetical protein DTO013E5_10179 [Penicillium roqueforti]|uniref:Genomic scaffold, ProqFM164S03 n=1 Tax=Penicillium roqueforti (strain FM164) TaxID=1365484 RepID=W6QAD9_PENRF|nr:uncharacterized protein LCP9604111_2988 [Penicillium roqueforti]CDM33350.1 unnamed protein product [Penicillium roqueforti FM164]KAF9250784.1 hypothetical protein LCP9604111_2988 [Penicillium roqueforti]KAI1830850.1 hypothetical protein CBS147337_8207 [Penicillium roqueforti]KAI2681405.1 hypothetical protein CBS147355_2615 [Penicillium roqueforti]KAI2688793.1 hypothetical protein LCP963914a_1882 [Penicillium roqueforti]